MTPMYRTQSRHLPLAHHALFPALLSLALAGCAASSGGLVPREARFPAIDVRAIAQLDPGSTLPPDWQHGAFMEIYVRGYRDSDGDGIGDLRGLTQSLDYLRDLGVRGIWLMPVTRSSDRDHGYAVVDYRTIEPDYGALADFDELLRQAHARGIGVIVDYVINHSSADHPLFRASKAAPASPYRNWYLWRDPAPTGWNIYGANPWYDTPGGAYFAAFSASMPDFNLRNAEVMAFHKDSMRFWLNRGVDGFRFDAVGHLIENGPDAWDNQPENFAVTRELQALVGSYRNRYMVCESPGNPLGFAASTACGSAFAFGHHENIVKAARGDSAAILAVANYFRTAPPVMATMVANHDLFAGDRLWNQLDGNAAQYRLAAATYLLAPGTPFIYYGEEIGMSSAANLAGDARVRAPMSWSGDPRSAGFTSGTPFRPPAANAATHNVAVERTDPESLLNFYKAMLGLRNRLPSIARGSYEHPVVVGSAVTYQRRLGSETTLVAINYGAVQAPIEIGNLPPRSAWAAAFPGNASPVTADGAGNAHLDLGARSVQVYTLHR